MENKKKELYQLFGTLGITQKEFEDWYNRWKTKFENKEHETEYEKSLPKLSEKDVCAMDREINKYLAENHEHNIKAINNFIQKVYMKYGFNKEEAKEMAFTELIFRIMSPVELTYFMKNVVEKSKDKA